MFSTKSVNALAREAVELLGAGDLESALRLIHDFVGYIVTEPLCTAQVYGSRTLDTLCQQIGAAALEAAQLPDIQNCNDFEPLYVYLVTRLQNSGGHRQVIFDLVSSRPNARHLILSTELAGTSDIEYLNSQLPEGGRVHFEAAPFGGFLARLQWLQRRLLILRPTLSYLFNHHQDSVAVAAIQPSMGLPAAFYHHGDHHLCLGVFLAHFIHIDPHPMGYFNCRKALQLDNRYIPLVAVDKGVRSQGTWMTSGYLVTCTAARSNKVEVPYFIQYVDLVPAMLEATKGRHIHIGRLTPWALWRVRREMRRRGVSSDQFIYIPWVRSVWEALLAYRVDLYIASFPYGGALTLIEAMGAGVPVALHRHIHSRLLSCVDMAYTGSFSWRTADELLAHCLTLSPASLEESSKAARAHYEAFHRPTALSCALGVSSDPGLTPLKPQASFTPATDEWAAWMASQLTFRRVAGRWLYRALKRLQARWL